MAGMDVLEVHTDSTAEITSVTNDSRKAVPGALFVAERGTREDGAEYIPEARRKGAAAVVCETPPPDNGPYILVRNARRACAVLASNFYGNPAKRLAVVGVTGTNGKTTVTNLVKELLERLTGKKVGLIGTNRNLIGAEELPAERTTPDAPELHALFRRMADAGCAYVVMEVSSHALALDRVYGVPFKAGVFTNLTEDHLDFHKTMDGYAEAKSKLFAQSEWSVLSADDPFFPRMLRAAGGRTLTVSTERTLTVETVSEADLTARNIQLRPDGVSFTIQTPEGAYDTLLAIPGRFSVSNGLLAVATVAALGADVSDAAEALRTCKGVKGRMEPVPTGRDFTVLIDYAHTPDALEKILRTVRGFTRGRVLLVFGCGGDRERQKRPLMGRIASELADLSFITWDNPRTEDPDRILRDIVAGIPSDASNYRVVPDRREAIREALGEAKAGDTVVLAGKGHETYQLVGTECLPLDERQVVAEVLAQAQDASVSPSLSR